MHGLNQDSKLEKGFFHKSTVFGFLFSIFPPAPLPLRPEKLLVLNDWLLVTVTHLMQILCYK